MLDKSYDIAVWVSLKNYPLLNRVSTTYPSKYSLVCRDSEVILEQTANGGSTADAKPG